MTTKTAEKREYLTAEEIETETVKLETLMDRLEQIAQATRDTTQKMMANLALEHLRFACAYIRRNRLDEAGERLLAAKAYIQEVLA